MLLSIVFIFAIINTIGWTDSQPIIPSYAPRYQLVYLTPPYQIHQYPQTVKLPTQPIINNRVLTAAATSDSVEDSLETNGEEEKYEVSQFHSEDADGRIVFGFHSPDQIRMEARDIDGSVRGSYSYIDPNGHVVKMQYWDDGSGFHAAGNNIPVAVHQVPEDTPDVKAARENHLRLYDAALQILKAINEQDDNKDDGSYMDTSNYEGDDYEEDDAPPEGGVIIENPAPPSSVYADSILSAEYPGKVEFSQTNQLSDNPQYNDEDKESVSIENPEFRSNNGIWGRKGKSQPEQEETGGGQNGNGEIVRENHPAGSDQAPALSRMDQPPPPPPPLLSAGTGVQSPASSVVVNDQQPGGNNNRAFFYHFTHTIPMPVERVENVEESRAVAAAAVVPEQTVSVKAQQLGGVPLAAAVHDAQVSPLQRELLPNFQLYQVYHPQID